MPVMMKQKQTRSMIVGVVLMVVLFVTCPSLLSWGIKGGYGKIEYLDHIDETIVTIDKDAYQLRDLACYLAMEEQTVEEQARIYNPENTRDYWNAHTNQSFISLEAKDFVMDTAVCDIIFYDMARRQNLKLTEEEQKYVENQQSDFWMDLEEEGQKRLGIEESEVREAFLKMALAQKQRQICADENGVDVKEYRPDGSRYQELLKQHTCKINDQLWQRLNFGKIVIDRKTESSETKKTAENDEKR